MKGLPKKLGDACHSGPGAALHRELPIGGGGGRGEANVEPGAPQGDRKSVIELRALAVPHPWPTGAAERRPAGADMTSSSSGESADEPRTPFGLGDRRLGEVEPEPVASTGRAIGAIGLVIGPGSALLRRLGLGVIICVGEANGF